MPSIIEIDLDEKYFQAKMKLCKPNRKPIDNMYDVQNRQLHVRLGNINELSFDIPYYVSRNHELIKNPLLDKIKLGFLIQLDFKGTREYFIFVSDSKQLNSNGDTISYKLQSLAYRLGKFDVRDLELEAETLTPTMIEILSETNWSLGSVDVDFDLTYRSTSISVSTVLQSVFEVALTFGAVPIFNTANRTIDFIKLESTGINRGLKTREGRYIESYGIETSLDEIVTRLKCYGQEGLDFRSLSPTGSNYIQDFSYFMYPFEVDENDNVIKSSENGMSDSLCLALTLYNRLLAENNTVFDTLTTDKTNLEDNVVQLRQELSVLSTELRTLNNQLDIINLTYAEEASNREDWITVNNNIDAKQLEITNKETEINTVNTNIEAIDAQILNLATTLSTESNFTLEQVEELQDYIYIKEFSDTSIAFEQDLLDAGIREFNKYRQPKVTLQFSLVDFIKDFQFKADRKKINLGDISTFDSKRFNVTIQTRITEIKYDLDEGNHSLTVSNDINNSTDEDILTNLLSSVNTASLTLNSNLYKLNQGSDANTLVNELLTSAYDTGRNILLGGVANTNEMTERGFYSRDYYNPTSTFLVINGGGMYITRDGARSVEVAINKDGVHAQRIIGRFILSERLLIDSESGVVNIQDNTLTIKDNNAVDRIQLGRYRDPDNLSNYKYGLNILDGAIDIRTSTSANRGIQFDANGFRGFNNNGVRVFEIDTLYGDLYFRGNIESSTITGSTIQTSNLPNSGIKLNSSGLSGYNSDGTRTVHLDMNGNLNVTSGTFSGNINASTITGGSIIGGFISGGSIIGTTITTTYDATVGNNLRIGEGNGINKSIIFSNTSSINYQRLFDGSSFTDERISISGGVRFNGNVEFTGIVSGVTATFG